MQTVGAWDKLPKQTSIPSVKAWLSVARSQRRPAFLPTANNCVLSENGRVTMLQMMSDIRGSDVDVPFHEAIHNAGLSSRFGGVKRNANGEAKMKQHPRGIDFKMGEQNDGGANELRGAVLSKSADGDEPWQPPPHLMMGLDWLISNALIVDLIDAARKDRGPLAESFDPKKKTTSKANSRTATFVVDYFLALVDAHTKWAAAQNASA